MKLSNPSAVLAQNLEDALTKAGATIAHQAVVKEAKMIPTGPRQYGGHPLLLAEQNKKGNKSQKDRRKQKKVE